MIYTPEKHHRRSIRLKNYDYSLEGACFVTVVCQNRENLFGAIKNGEMVLNDAGKMIETWWCKIPGKFTHTEIDEFMIMPNHFHGILSIVDNVANKNQITVGVDPCVNPVLCVDNERIKGQTHGSAQIKGQTHGSVPTNAKKK